MQTLLFFNLSNQIFSKFRRFPLHYFSKYVEYYNVIR